MAVEGNIKIFPKPCDDSAVQKWLLDAPFHQETNTEEDQSLLTHHQFAEDNDVDRSNILEREIKQVY